MAEQLTHRGRRTYNNASNRKKIRRTPGNRRVYLPYKKGGVIPKCITCKGRLNGIDVCRQAKISRIRKSQRTVTRTYGGNLCGSCLSERIIGAFLDSEERTLAEKRGIAPNADN